MTEVSGESSHPLTLLVKPSWSLRRSKPNSSCLHEQLSVQPMISSTHATVSIRIHIGTRVLPILDKRGTTQRAPTIRVKRVGEGRGHGEGQGQACLLAIFTFRPSRIPTCNLPIFLCNSFSSTSRSSRSLNPRLITPGSRPKKRATSTNR